MTAERFDLVVIGGGAAGEKGAAQAAYFGKRVAVIERRAEPGGATVHTGTLPSKTLREAALFLSGYRQRDLYGVSVEVSRDLEVAKLVERKNAVRTLETERMLANLDRHHVELVHGTARLVDAATVAVVGEDAGVRTFAADAVLHCDGLEPVPTAGHPVRGPRCARLGHDPGDRPAARVPGRARRRRDRVRVRLDVRGVGHRCAPDRAHGAAAAVPRRRGRRADGRRDGGARRDLPLRRARRDRLASRRRPGLFDALGRRDRGRQGARHGRAHRQHRRPRSRGGRGRDRRAGPRRSSTGISVPRRQGCSPRAM